MMPPHKAMSVIHAVLAGADSIGDCDVQRAGAAAAVLGHTVLALSSNRRFLRSFSWAHCPQLDSVAGDALARAARGTRGQVVGEFTIDLDSSIADLQLAKKRAPPRSPTSSSVASN